MPVIAAALLAHQGGWDEALFVLGPLGVIILLLRAAKKRAAAMSPHPDDPPSQGTP